MVPADSRRIPRVPRYSGYRYAKSGFVYRIITFYDAPFQELPLTLNVQWRGPTTPRRPCDRHGLGSSPFARHYWGNHYLFSLPRGTKMFQFPRLASGMIRIGGLQPPGLSHSEIRESMAICAYPRLIAAYHVLLRLNEPRHPPCALSYFRLTLLYPSTWDRGRRPYFSCVLWMSPTGGLYLAYDNLAAAQALQSCLCQYVKDLLP